MSKYKKVTLLDPFVSVARVFAANQAARELFRSAEATCLEAIKKDNSSINKNQ